MNKHVAVAFIAVLGMLWYVAFVSAGRKDQLLIAEKNIEELNKTLADTKRRFQNALDVVKKQTDSLIETEKSMASMVEVLQVQSFKIKAYQEILKAHNIEVEFKSEETP